MLSGVCGSFTCIARLVVAREVGASGLPEGEE